MVQPRNKVCGIDIHKKFLVATILARDGTRIQKRFGADIDDLLNFRDWVLEENCDCVAIESTGVYWYPVNAVLENKVELILANTHIRFNILLAKRRMLWIRNGSQRLPSTI